MCGVVREYADEVKIQPYETWNVRSKLMNDLAYSERRLIVICYHDFFQAFRRRLLYMAENNYFGQVMGVRVPPIKLLIRIS